MIDDFKPAPERQPVRIDSPRSFQPQIVRAGDVTTEPAKIERPVPDFKTPEEIASEEARQTDNIDNDTNPSDDDQRTVVANSDELLLPAHASADALPGREAAATGSTIRLFRKWTVSRKKFIIVTAATAVLLLGSGAAFALTRPDDTPVAKKSVATKIAAPAPKPIVSPLTGVTVSTEQQALPVIGAMIENSPDARPQSGLKDAGIVYEAIAEAGITRFLALYQESQPGNIGPIRSSRPYYLDWAMAFDASYAHVGGSPDALQRIKDIGVRDLDQFFNPAAYHRITTRYAPHNVYTGEQQLVDLAKSKGYDKSSFTSFARKADNPYKPASESSTSPNSPKTNSSTKSEVRTPANSIDLAISSSFYNAHYDYDAVSNSYKRSEGGEPHIDADSKAQLAPKVVISLVMPYSLMADGYHSQYNTIGSGKMYVFQDGTVTTGTWTKGEPKSQFEFKDEAGQPIALNAGQTWISVVGAAGNVSYQ